MRIDKIEFKNVFAYGNILNTIEYTDKGKLILLKGKSGTGKSAILNLPGLLLYGKINKIPKNSVANRINKNGFIRGTITKNNHTYVIERYFNPNDLKVYKDGVDLQASGPKDAQDYIDNEIIDMPYHTFSNTIAISMKQFKSFLTMTPTDRKNIIDRIFSMEIINMVSERIKSDAKDVGNNINADNSALHSLSITLQNTNNELLRLQQQATSEEDKNKLTENSKLISEYTEKVNKLTDAYQKINIKQQEINNTIAEHRQSSFGIDMNINEIQNKLNLFSQDKCPTCGSSFKSENYAQVREKLNEMIAAKLNDKESISKSIQELESNKNILIDYLNKIINEVNKVNSLITQLKLENNTIEATINAGSQFTSINSIIEQTTRQISDIRNNIDQNTKKMVDLQNLLQVYSVDGVKQQVINNYLPLLNKEIGEHLLLLNFPYQLEFDSKFEPSLTDIGTPIDIATLSDGEQTRIDLVCLCSLLKLLKMKYNTINIFSLDETISTLDKETGEMVLKFLKEYSNELNINIFIVSHVEIENECFDEQIEVIRTNGFSEIRVDALK